MRERERERARGAWARGRSAREGGVRGRASSSSGLLARGGAGGEDLGAPAELIEASSGGAQNRVPEREREENVRVDDDDEGRRDHETSSRTLLLQLGIVAAELLRHLGELAKAGTAILVALLLELEHVFDPQPPMLAGLAERDAPLVEKAHEVLA